MNKPDGALPVELRRRRLLFSELRRRALWFIQLRWFVPPGIAVGAFVADVLGFEFAILPVLAIGCFILAYNLVFHLVRHRIYEESQRPDDSVRRFTYYHVGFDYAAMFLLIHFTGGAASPFIFFFIFHVIFASILLPPRAAFGFAGLSAIGMVAIATAEYVGLIPHHPIVYDRRSIDLAWQPVHLAVELLFFSASVLISAFLTTTIVRMLRTRMIALDQTTAEMFELNDKLKTLYLVIEAVGSKQKLGQVLQITKQELLRVLDVKGLSVKLLSEDGKLLRYAAAEGLPNTLTLANSIILDKSPFNKRIVEGEPFITGNISEQESFQFGEDLAAEGFRSVLFVPLRVDGKVIGVLGAYCTQINRFGEEDIRFFTLAASLVAIAIQNAKAYEAIERLGEERSRFMLRVAHNLRAPQAAVLSILNVVRNGYLGDLNEKQDEYLGRVERRMKHMVSMINELLALARSRSGHEEPGRVPIDMTRMARQLKRTFEADAEKKGLTFRVKTEKDCPVLHGESAGLEQMMENLVSNAVKYTMEGSVEVGFSRGPAGCLRIEVSDTGIGIAADDLPQLYTDFFRAETAKEVEEIGTGLGLAIVKETVDRHGGKIEVQSEVGRGTTIFVHLPVGDTEVLDEIASRQK